MEIILKQDVTGLGYKNDTVKVKPGYGRNYLIPNGVALIANDSNKRMVAENIRQAAHKAAKLKQDAEALAAKIGEIVLEIGTKAGESGRIFGAVTAGKRTSPRSPVSNMLSRVADSLFWMSRYLERAEHTARVLNVHLNLMLERGSGSDDPHWSRVLRSLGGDTAE